MKIVILGAGFAGCSAAISAGMQGAEVLLVERTDLEVIRKRVDEAGLTAAFA